MTTDAGEDVTATEREVSDGFGSTWTCHNENRCGLACGLQVVRPGRAQCWCDDDDFPAAILGGLVDAVMDDLKPEVSHCPEVIDALDQACRLLGGDYLPYLDEWPLAEDDDG